MKICYPFCDFVNGGAENYALYLAKEAKRNGHKVSFIIGAESPMIKEFQISNFKFQIIPMPSSFNPFLVLRSAFALRKYFKENDIEIVHTQMLREQSICLVAKIFGAKIKLIRTFHRLDQFNLKMKPLMWLYRWQTDGFIAVSEYVSEYLQQIGIKNKIHVIYNGTPEIKVHNHSKGIGFLGRLVSEKGIDNFIKKNHELLRKNNDINLYIAGSGPNESEVKLQIAKNKLQNIKLLGQVNNLSGFFEKISVLILPSETESTMPLAAIEALSVGIPVIVFDLEAIEKSPRNDSVILIGKEKYEEMARSAFGLINDVGKWQRYSRKARNLYREKYTLDKMWEKTQGLYRLLMGS